MTIDELRAALTAQTNQAALATFSGSIMLQLGAHLANQDPDANNHLTLRVTDSKLQWLPHGTDAEAIFYFADSQQALALLTGQAHVMDEFMAGRFRSNGYLLWTAPLLSLFRG